MTQLVHPAEIFVCIYATHVGKLNDVRSHLQSQQILVSLDFVRPSWPRLTFISSAGCKENLIPTAATFADVPSPAICQSRAGSLLQHLSACGCDAVHINTSSNVYCMYELRLLYELRFEEYCMHSVRCARARIGQRFRASSCTTAQYCDARPKITFWCYQSGWGAEI